MPANLGMIALGKVNTLEKKLKKLELAIEEITKQVREENIRTADQSKSEVSI